jgi:glyceraldehyde 3-phosphate dehydrogenase
MNIPYAINGLGRIGRALLRAARVHPELRLVAVNDLASPAVLARLVARDSVYGPYPGQVRPEGPNLILDGRKVPVFAAAEPSAIPWQKAAPRLVVEATGASRTGAFARGHLQGGVEQVVAVWNPQDPQDVDLTLCLGVNEGALDRSRHRLISAASCTTNAIAPLAMLLDRAFGLRRGLSNSVHAVTNNQALLDGPHGDPRRSRSALLNIIPTPSHAARAVASVLPRLAGKLDGFAVRVPTGMGALLDLVVELERPASAEAVRDLLRQAAAAELAGILTVTEEELVSSDFVGNPASVIVDLPLVQVVDGGLLRVVGWYDNEWGYAHRLAEILVLLGGGRTEEARNEKEKP